MWRGHPNAVLRSSVGQPLASQQKHRKYCTALDFFGASPAGPSRTSEEGPNSMGICLAVVAWLAVFDSMSYDAHPRHAGSVPHVGMSNVQKYQTLTTGCLGMRPGQVCLQALIPITFDRVVMIECGTAHFNALIYQHSGAINAISLQTLVSSC